MLMLERYLHAIEFWLPTNQRQDILAEISEDLNSQIEEQQSALGRKTHRLRVGSLAKAARTPSAGRQPLPAAAIPHRSGLVPGIYLRS